MGVFAFYPRPMIRSGRKGGGGCAKKVVGGGAAQDHGEFLSSGKPSP